MIHPANASVKTELSSQSLALLTSLVPTLLRERLVSKRAFVPGMVEQRQSVVAVIRLPTSQLIATLEQVEKPEVLAAVLNTLYEPIISTLVETGAIIAEVDAASLTAVFLLDNNTQAGRVLQALISVESALKKANEKTAPGYPDIRWELSAGVGIGTLALTTFETLHRQVFVVDGPAIQQAEDALAHAAPKQLLVHRDAMKRLGSAPQGDWVKLNYFLPTDSFTSSAVGQILAESSYNANLVGIQSLSSRQRQSLTEFLDPALRSIHTTIQKGFRTQRQIYLILRVSPLNLFTEGGLDQWKLLLDKLVGTAERYGGMVYQIQGRRGEFHLVLGDPLDDDELETRAVSCALALQRILHPIEPSLSIGIAAGEAFMGFLGYEHCRATIFINEASSRARQLMTNRADSHEVLVTQGLQNATEHAFSWRALGGDPPTYALAGELTLGSGLLPRLQIARRTFIIGRDDERTEFKRLAHFCQATRERQLILISGTSGTGRSTLIDILIEEWLEAGGNGFIAIGPSHTPPAPYALWFSIWQALFDLTAEADPAQNLEHLQTAIVRLLPDYEGVVELFAEVLGLSQASSPAVAGLSPQARQQRLIDANTAIFRQIAELTPFLLVFEHLDYADSLSLILLDDLYQNIEDAPVMICIEDRGNPAHSLYPRFPMATRIEAKPLSGQAAWTLLDRLLPDVDWPYSHRKALEERLGVRGDTKPTTPAAYVVALATTLEQTVLDRHDQTWVFNESFPPQEWPRDLVETTELLVQTALSQEEVQIALRASVSGTLFYHYAPWLHPSDSSLEIGRLRSLHLTEPYMDFGYPRRWDRFRHEQMREALYFRLDIPSRLALHQQVATWLALHQPGQAGQAAVAFHLQYAGQLLEAVDAHLRACNYAASWGAEAEALQNLLAAERLLAHHDNPESQEALVQIHLARALLYLRSEIYERGLTDISRALVIAENLKNNNLIARCLVLRGRFHQAANDIESARQDAEKAAQLSTDNETLAQAYWLQSRALNTNGQYREAVRLLNKAIDTGAVQDLTIQIEMGLDAARILLMDYYRDRARVHILRAHDQAEKLGDPVILHEVLTLVGHLELLYGEAEKSVATLERALTYPAPPDAGVENLGNILADLAIDFCYLGRYADAEATFDTAIGYYLAEGNEAHALRVDVLRANELYLDRHDLDLAQATLDAARQQSDLLDVGLRMLIELTQIGIYIRQRNYSAAQTVLNQLDQQPNSQAKQWYMPIRYVRAAQLALVQQNYDQAIHLASRSLGSVSLNGDLRQLTVAYCLLAEAMILRGDKSPTIQDALERAVRVGRQQGRRRHLARALYLLGEYMRQTALRYNSARARGSTYRFEADLLFKEMDLPLEEEIPPHILEFWSEASV